MEIFDAKKIREDFPIYKNTSLMDGHPLAYLDNAATTFKPYKVIDAIRYYYENETSNAHRGDYRLSANVDYKYELARKKVAKFINAKDIEVCFTSGTSMSLNMIAYGLADLLNEGDEIEITSYEHGSVINEVGNFL